MRISNFLLALIVIQIAGLALENDSFATELQIASIEVGIVFSSDEIRIIRAHCDSGGGNNHKGKGKNKHKGLPPGIAKNLARGKPLPPGIAKRSLPRALGLALPPVQDGYERIIVAGKILLIEIANQMVVDILSDALFE